MQLDHVRLLQVAAQKVAIGYSDPSRQKNVLKETFMVERLEVLGEATALVTMHKEPTDKKALFFFTLIRPTGRPYWQHCVLTYAHLAGLRHAEQRLIELEQHNLARSIATIEAEACAPELEEEER
jgi:hypothetical protein